MRGFFKQELKTLQAITGIRQLENLMQKDNWKDEANLLIDMMVQECERPPFDLVAADVKQRVIHDAILTDKEFIGLNAKFVRKALNAWWLIYGGKIIEAMNQAEKDQPKPEYSGPPIDVDTLITEYLKTLRSNQVPRLSEKEIKEEGQVRPKAHTYRSTDIAYMKEVDERVRKGREMQFRQNYPQATEEQVKQYLDSF